MKYIKTYEKMEGFTPELDYIPGMMYIFDKDTPVCFIGYTENKKFPILCLILRPNYNGQFEFIDWVPWLELKPLNISLKNYILDKRIVGKIIDTLHDNKYQEDEIPSYALPSYAFNQKNLIKKIEDELLDDPEVRMLKEIEEEVNKYNL